MAKGKAKRKAVICGGGGAGTIVAKCMEADGRAEAVALFEPSDRRRRQLRKELPNAEVGTDYVALFEK